MLQYKWVLTTANRPGSTWRDAAAAWMCNPLAYDSFMPTQSSIRPRLTVVGRERCCKNLRIVCTMTQQRIFGAPRQRSLKAGQAVSERRCKGLHVWSNHRKIASAHSVLSMDRHVIILSARTSRHTFSPPSLKGLILRLKEQISVDVPPRKCSLLSLDHRKDRTYGHHVISLIRCISPVRARSNRRQVNNTCLSIRLTISYRFSHVESLLPWSLVRLQRMHNTADAPTRSGALTTTPPAGLS